MHRVDTSTAAAELPAQDPVGTPGFFTKGSQATATPATVPGQDWFNAIQEELVAICTAAGVVLAKGTYTQVLQALGVLFATKQTETNYNAHAASVAPHSGHETPSGAQARVDFHGNQTSPHSSTATPIANRLPKYDAMGRLEAFNGVSGNDVVNFIQLSEAKGTGVEQSWSALTFTNGVTYRNTTGKPITLCARSPGSGGSGENYYFDVLGGVSSADVALASGTATLGHQTVTVIIPNLHYYKFNGVSTVRILS